MCESSPSILREVRVKLLEEMQISEVWGSSFLALLVPCEVAVERLGKAWEIRGMSRGHHVTILQKSSNKGNGCILLTTPISTTYQENLASKARNELSHVIFSPSQEAGH